MRWTTERPTKPGWYWIKQGCDIDPQIVEVKLDDTYVLYCTVYSKYYSCFHRYRVCELINNVYWAGLIEEPAEELKPCPFCGGEARFIRDAEYVCIVCNSCYASSIRYKSTVNEDIKEIITERWNRRA